MSSNDNELKQDGWRGAALCIAMFEKIASGPLDVEQLQTFRHAADQTTSDPRWSAIDRARALKLFDDAIARRQAHPVPRAV
jgi:hypothetical protein